MSDTIRGMNEEHFSEVETTLLYVSDARERAEKAHKALAKQKAEPHLVAALVEAEDALMAVHRKLMQSTYFAVPES